MFSLPPNTNLSTDQPWHVHDYKNPKRCFCFSRDRRDASLPYLTFGVSDKSRLLDAEIHRHEDAERAVDIKLGARGS